MSGAGTLLDVLFDAAQEAPDQVIVQVASDGSEQVQTYCQLLDASLRVAGGLRAANLSAGTPVILLAGGTDDFLPGFWGALLAGLVPVPLAPVPEKVLGVWTSLHRPPFVVPKTLASFPQELLDDPVHALTIEDLRRHVPTTMVHRPAPDDLAFLQFSSGSTGTPKGVELTHANVVANVDQARRAGSATPSDVMVSWLPYFHDMGLIGAHLAPLSVRIKQVKLDPIDFGKRPALWYETAARHRATLMPMASFALALTLKRVPSEQVARWDLSSVRLVGVGAEPISVRTWQRYLDHLRPARLAPSALVPAYGLAEATLAVALPPTGEVARPLVLDRGALADGRAVDAHADQPASEFMDVGYAVPGGELRIVGCDGEVLGDSLVGQIEFSGPNVARGYHQRPDETATTFVDGWLRTGDLGFLRDRRLCVTGRSKDVMFVNGQKYHAHDLEQVVASTPGVPSGRVAVVGCTHPATGAERVVVFVPSTASVAALAAVRARVREALAYDDVHVLPLPSRDFPRTTSGKLERATLRQRYAAGDFNALDAQTAPAQTAASTRPQPPRHAVEEQITRIWSEVLKVPADAISREDRFLAIGGTSLAAMHVLSELEEAFGGPIEPAVLRDCATVSALAEHLVGRHHAPAAPAGASESGSGQAAVIGLACRFPDADTPDAFWNNLASGRDSVTEVPATKWGSHRAPCARWGAFLDDTAGFDAGYFGVAADEATVMDPHARIFLEVAHEALERAGYAGQRRQGRRIGVFVAVGESGYQQLLHEALDRGLQVGPSALVGNLRNLIAARVAHCLDLSGPVLAVDTACSSSLVALHLARRSLEAGECDMAVVGGVSLNLTATPYRLLEAAQALSVTGRCRAFSRDADGFVPGEGAAAIVLEPLATAQAAGDQVLAVVRGSAVNNDGRSMSLMAPNPLLQEAVIAEAYREAGIDPATVSYVEAHGTGTSIGDPIEARSLMRNFPREPGPRWLGSVKTNVGHLLNAAGMPSLLKVVLALKHRRLPASLHYAGPSPEFDLASAGFEVVTKLREWSSAGPLRGGINSFGFGGTNAHVILEQAPADIAQPAPAAGPHLLTLSAATEGALRASAAHLAAHARSNTDLDEGDLCASASTARDHGRYRVALVANGDLPDRLDTVAAMPAFAPARRRPRLVLVLPGQGSQRPAMGRTLHQSQSVYRQMMMELSSALGLVEGRSLVSWSLDDVDPVELARTTVAQPLLVAFGIALAAQLRAWGVEPDAVLGHSVGELAAAAVSGALSPTDAVTFAGERGSLMQQHCAPGAMAAVRGIEAHVTRVLAMAEGELSVAAANGPEHFVISGPAEAVDAAVSALAECGCRAHRLRVSHAFHSAMMDPAEQSLRSAAGTLAVAPQQVPLLSTATGDWTPTLDADYFADHARRPVLFGPSVQRLLDDGYDTFIELGPGANLTGLVRSIARTQSPALDIAALTVGQDVAATAGRLWERGVSISRPGATAVRRRVEVPAYPFQRQRYWLCGTDHAPATRISTQLHRFAWSDVPLRADAVLRSVCVLGQDTPLARQLADRLAQLGVSVTRRKPGQLHAAPPSSVMVLLAGPAVDIDRVEAVDAVARDASTAMLELARSLQVRPTPLVVVTEDVAITGTGRERGCPGQAVAAGLAMALSEEHPQQAVRVVDLCSLDDEPARLVALVRELYAPLTRGPAESVAWRQGRRLAKAPLLDEVLEPGTAATLPSEGCYLITGGAGGIGAEVARFLAGHGRCRLVLVGRTPTCPPALLEELRQRGATAHYVAADLSVESDVEDLVAALPPLDGVFHAAGLVDTGKVASKTVHEIERVLAPKVRGTYLLARALDRTGRRPGPFVTFSSVASALPGYAGGLGPYAAANAFLDAFTLAETHAGRPMQVLNFAAWADTGMAATPAFRAVARGVPQLTAAQALRALCDATTIDAAQLLVLDSSSVTASPAPAPVAPGAMASPVRDVVAGLIAAELGQRAEDLDDDTSFLAMGLDSLTAVDLVKTLEQELGRPLPTTLLFEYPSVSALSTYLSDPPSHQLAIQEPEQRYGASFALTPVQVAFDTTGRLHPGAVAHAALRQTIAGPLDVPLLARSLAVLEHRHSMLRMRIRPDVGRRRQVVEPPLDRDWPGWFVTEELDRPVADVEDELCNRGFDLAHEAPIRALLLREGAGRSSLLIVLSHSAADGASLNVLSEELWQVYTDLSRGRPPQLPPLRSDFRDYADAIETLRASQRYEEDVDYWRDRLGGTRPNSLPYDGDPAVTGALSAHQFTISTSLTSALQARAAQLDVSLFHLLLTAYLRRLADWSGDDTVTANVARSGRDARLPDIERLVGPFADTLPITVAVSGASDVGALARRVRGTWLDSERHAGVTTLDLARLLPTVDAAPRTAGTASFSFARFPIAAPPGCPVRVVATAARTGSAATRLGLVCWEFEGALQFAWNFPTQLFLPATIGRLTAEYVAELEGVVGPATVRPSVAQRIQAQCRRTPDAVAVDSGATALTYAQLDSSAQQLAARLRGHHIVAGDRVALLTTPGAATLTGLVGILYTGAAWVPLDAAHPVARLTDQVRRADVSVVVCDRSTRAVANRLGVAVVDLDTPPADQPSVDPDQSIVGPGDIAYVIFTSGTTGRPKGVPILHSAMAAYLDWAIATFGYCAGDRMLATASICFDASIRQLLAPLLVGATIVSTTRDGLRDPQALLTTVVCERVTVWSSVPTLWRQLLRAGERQVAAGESPDLSALRWVHVGGESLSPTHVRRWFDLCGPGSRIVNLYGPTEATINATYDVIDERPGNEVTRLAIGRPVADTLIDVVGPTGASCGPGQPGELHLAGPALTPGYLDEPDLTAAAFVHRRGKRWYRTGDRVVLRPDGRLEFLGRTDRQVKVRGHRVELEEIETVLQQHPGVEGASVVEVPGQGRLIAYVQLEEAGEGGVPDDLRAHLASLLPDYMVPALLRRIKRLPLTPAGKVDVAQLPASPPEEPPAGRIGTPAASETEKSVARVWTEVLGVDPVLREDDFFALGGDSIAVLEVSARLEAHVPSLPAPTALYRHRTLADFAHAVDASRACPTEPPGGADTRPFALTPSQRGFLLAEALSAGARSGWLACLRLDGALDAELFQQAIDLLVARHLMLRVRFSTSQRPPTQQEVPAPASLPATCERIEPDQLAERIADEREHRFDSSHWPLVRLRLFQLAPDKHALVVHAHHLIGDGYSVVVLGQDLMTLYDGLASGRPAEMPELRSTFRDYARLMTHAEDQDDQPTSEPTRYDAPVIRSSDMEAEPDTVASKATFIVDRETTTALRQLALSEGTTPYAPLLTAYYRALVRLTGRDDLVLGVATTGRDHLLPDIDRMVGPLATVLPVRLRCSGPATLRAQLRQVADTVTGARADGTSLQSLTHGPSAGSQFLFSHLDFDSIGQIGGHRLSLSWDETGTDLEPPRIGTDLLLTVRTDDGTLRVTLRAAAAVMLPSALSGFAEDLHRELHEAVSPLNRGLGDTPSPSTQRPSGALDAALVGYLPAPRDLAALASLPISGDPREVVRSGLFPGRRARLLERLSTPLGSTGFVCLPVFADELGSLRADALAHHVARAVELATALGATCVSLAGMLPARTSYGFDVVRALGPTTARVTTGHAATTVSVVKTAAAALAHGGRELGEVTVACVGLGSIGRSSLELLIARAGSPRRLLLCDVASRARHLTEMAAELAVGGQAVDVCYSEASLPVDVYEADLVVAATSSDGWILDVDRLQPGTIVVDDSFPHCFDTAAAIRRMQSEGDVLVVGGGLLSCGPSEQAPAADLVLPTGAEQALRIRLRDTIASCQIESLLHVGRPDLPLVHGLVDLPHSLAYWEALSDVSAAPLHLLHHVVSPDSLMLFAEHSRRARASAAAPVTFDPVAGSSVAVSSTTGASAMRGECQPG